jgi:glycosyltransferase involved in cell wall biosynthesis
MIKPEEIRSAQFNDTYFPIVDGVVQTVHNYAEQMNRSAYTCVVTPKPLKKEYDDSGLSYEVYRTSMIGLPIAEYGMPAPRIDGNVRQWLAERDLHIFHAHSPFFEGAFASSYAKKLGIPVVATFHSKYFDDVVHITGSKTIARIATKRIVRFFNSVDSVWACSYGTADTLRSYGYGGDVFVMDNGTTFKAPDNPEELKLKAAKTFGIPEDKKILLFVGHQIWHKNLKLVLDTFKMLCDHSDDYRLLIAGNGYDEKEVRKYAESLHFREGRLRFLGKIMDRDLLSGVYLNADLFFFPSVYDNSPLVVREAASLGVPSLLTEGSNAAEAVKRNVTGFTAAENKVAMYGEILRVFGTEGLLKKVGEGAREHVAKPWEEIIPLVREKYTQIIEQYSFEHKV